MYFRFCKESGKQELFHHSHLFFTIQAEFVTSQCSLPTYVGSSTHNPHLNLTYTREVFNVHILGKGVGMY